MASPAALSKTGQRVAYVFVLLLDFFEKKTPRKNSPRSGGAGRVLEKKKAYKYHTWVW